MTAVPLVVLAAVQLDCARAGAADTLIAVADVGVQEQQFCGTRGPWRDPLGIRC